MNYTVVQGKNAPFLDENGDPIPEGVLSSVVFSDPAVAAITGINGILHIQGLTEGTTAVTATRGGKSVTHDVTVLSSFDWSLGMGV